MGFHSEDIYVQGGDNKILHMWTPGVEKFDTSSFYNWEQDNIPLYDLEERTYYLWEKAGWPTSGLPQVSGVVFTVSADAIGTDEYANNPNLFLDLSAAINTLPDIIRYPIRIEVANFGDLGELVLNNVHFTGSGALEIVNRNFAPILPGNYDVTDPSAIPQDGVAGAAAGNFSNNSTPFIGTLSSLDLSNTISETSALDISTAVVNGIADTRYQNNNTFLVQTVHARSIASNKIQKTARMTLGLNSTTPFNATNPNQFDLDVYGTDNDISISSYDFSSCTNQITDTAFGRQDIQAETDISNAKAAVVGAFYGNFLQKLEVNNCGGSIYLRNFLVDGAWGVTSPTSHITKKGINVHNSDIVLEHCAAMRCYEAGFNFTNSKVVLSRGAIAYRNYALSSNTNPGSNWRADVPDAAGFRFYNSDVQISSLPTYGASGAGNIFTSTRNTNGLIMQNSFLKGPNQVVTAAELDSNHCVQVYENVSGGINMHDSFIDLPASLDVWMHEVGVKAHNSKISVNDLHVDCHNVVGVHLVNSELEYAKSLRGQTTANVLSDAVNLPTTAFEDIYYWSEYPAQVHFDSNGQHLILDNSRMYHPRLSMGAGLSRTKYKRNHGTALGQLQARKLSVPGVVCQNNSDLQLTYARLETQATDAAFAAGGGKPDQVATADRKGTANAMYGSCLLVKNNSNCRLVGGDQKYTLLDGPDDYSNQVYNTGAYVTNNSKLEVYGPTLMIRLGVDVLVDDNSILDMGVARDDYGFPDNDQWDLSGTTGNQTKIGLHSSRACLVANNNSVINMEDMGDYNGHWASGTQDEIVAGEPDIWYASGLVLSANYDTYETSNTQSHGSLQFYPNPQQIISPVLDTYDPTAKARPITEVLSFPLYQGGGTGNGGDGSEPNDVSALSHGGMCLRAMHGSRVNVRNVHFPAGWNNTSSLYYDYATTSVDPNECNQLRIWNIDETSQLDMSYVSVSGHFPPLVGYHGPSAVYTSANGAEVAFGAPDSTEMTSSLSVLDSFGASGSIPGQNFGPFRLYVAPKRYSKFLVYKDMPPEETSIIYQTIAQGYNMSGPCSAVLTDPSSGPDIYSIYGAGPTNPSSIQGDISFSSTTASAYFSGAPYGRVRDWRIYTSAVGMLASSVVLDASNNGLNTQSNRDASSWSASSDGVPGVHLANYVSGGILVKPLLRHYKEADFFYTEDLVPVGYEGRIRLDESAIAIFANAKNATMGTSRRPRLVTLKTSTTNWAGEGAESEAAQAGKGFLSASEFDLNKLD
jgi:hypothetical protein